VRGVCHRRTEGARPAGALRADAARARATGHSTREAPSQTRLSFSPDPCLGGLGEIPRVFARFIRDAHTLYPRYSLTFLSLSPLFRSGSQAEAAVH